MPSYVWKVGACATVALSIRARWASNPEGAGITRQTIRRECGSGVPTEVAVRRLGPTDRDATFENVVARDTCTITLTVTDRTGTTTRRRSVNLGSGSNPGATLGSFGAAVMITPQKVAELRT